MGQRGRARKDALSAKERERERRTKTCAKF